MALFDPKALPEEPPRWDLSPIVPEFAGLEDYPAKLKSKFDALADQLVADMQALQPLIDDMNARASGGQKLTVAEVMEPVARKKELGELSERYQTFFRLVYNEHYTDPAYSELQDYAHDRLNYAAFEGGKAMRSFQLPPSCVNNLVRQDPEIEKYRSLFEGDLRMREAYVAPSDRSTQQEQIDPRNVNVRKLFQAVNTSRELAADPKSHEDA